MQETILPSALVIIRGAGDISTGTIHRLFRAGFPVLVLEAGRPSAIRRRVAFSEAVYDGTATVEGVTAVRVGGAEEAGAVLARGRVPVLVDPSGESIRRLRPAAVVDAILAKRNLGTTMNMAPLTIALGPGFEAGRDVHFVIETMRGHDLGRIIASGSAAPNTGIPGIIGGYGAERVIHAPAAGVFRALRDIGSVVAAGEAIGRIDAPEGQLPVRSKIAGLLRGILRDGYPVLYELKNCATISDKARCIAGSVLELVSAQANRERRQR